MIHLDDTSNAPNWRTDDCYRISPYSLPFNPHHNSTSAYHLHPGRVALVINTGLPSPDIYTSQTDKLVSFDGRIWLLEISTRSIH